MAYYGRPVYYRGHLDKVKSMTLLHDLLLIQFYDGRVIAYENLGTPKVIFEEE
ncbi:MAG: hypothetical protein KAS32_13720 [Candidatus Peribacteraceae bacterium]|nr:hypothetical protein [Candidatus Peribacteraceae bacterium]